MIGEIISERELRSEIALWMLENKKGIVLPEGMTAQEYAESCSLPDLDFTHSGSYADSEGNLVTLLKAKIKLSDWETKNGRAGKELTVYKVLKTPASNPDTEPFPSGYITVK
jgi:hypothetical protein